MRCTGISSNLSSATLVKTKSLRIHITFINPEKIFVTFKNVYLIRISFIFICSTSVFCSKTDYLDKCCLKRGRCLSYENDKLPAVQRCSMHCSFAYFLVCISFYSWSEKHTIWMAHTIWIKVKSNPKMSTALPLSLLACFWCARYEFQLWNKSTNLFVLTA